MRKEEGNEHFCLALSKLVTKSAKLLGNLCSFVVVVVVVALGNRSTAPGTFEEGSGGAGSEADDTAGDIGIA
jgi:hypothetical protein